MFLTRLDSVKVFFLTNQIIMQHLSTILVEYLWSPMVFGVTKLGNALVLLKNVSDFGSPKKKIIIPVIYLLCSPRFFYTLMMVSFICISLDLILM